MTTIYRIEGYNGTGICETGGLCRTYHTKDPGHWCCRMNFSFGQEIKIDRLMYNEHGRFGFQSLDQLRLWFPSEAGRQAMKDRGGHIVVYDTEAPTYSDENQIVFDVTKSRIMRTMDLVELK